MNFNLNQKFMKKLFIISFASMALFSCTKAEKIQVETSAPAEDGVITVKMPSTKTYLGEEVNGEILVLWEEGDFIRVYEGGQSAVYKLKEGAGDSVATFEYCDDGSFVPSRMTKVEYPATYNASSLTWQIYRADSFDKRVGLLRWEGDANLGDPIVLDHANSLVCVRIAGTEEIAIDRIKITLTSSGNSTDYNIQPKNGANEVVPVHLGTNPVSFYIVTEPKSNASASLVLFHNGSTSAYSTFTSTKNRDYKAGEINRFSMPIFRKLNIVGDACDWGWTINETDGKFTVKDATTYTWTGNLSNKHIKLNAGDNALQIRWDTVNQPTAPAEITTWKSRIFLNGKIDCEDKSFKIADAGRYTVEYNALTGDVTLFYLGMRSDAALVKDGLYMYGAFGWAITDARAMQTEDDDTYTLTADLAKGKTFKFLTKSGAWYPSFVKSSIAGNENKLLYRGSNNSPAADKSWTIPSDGNYTVTARISDLSISIVKND